MFFDLNVPWTAKVADLERTILLLHEFNYNVICISYLLSGKLPSVLTSPVPAKLPFSVPPKLRIFRRCTLVLSDPTQNHRLSSLSEEYDLLALRPTNEKSMQQACLSLDCDLISLDMTVRHDYHFKMRMLKQAIERGIKFEICYGPGLASMDSNARRNMISNATQLIRATRGRGIVISSDAPSASACRAPADVVNLAAVWGLSQERGKEALSKLARSVVVSAQLKRNSFRGVVDVVYGGEKPEKAAGETSKKRKVDQLHGNEDNGKESSNSISKREQKRRAKAARDTNKHNSTSHPNLSAGAKQKDSASTV